MRVLRVSLVLLLAAGCGGKLDEDAIGSGSSKATGATRAPTGGAVSDLAKLPAPSDPTCALKQPFRDGFDEARSSWANWGAVAPGNLKFDPTASLSGAQGLRIDVPREVMYRGFFSHTIAPSCALTLRFAIKHRAPLFSDGETATIVRIFARPDYLDVLVGPQGALSVVEVAERDGTAMVPSVPGGPGGGMRAPSKGIPHPIGSLTANEPATIAIGLDLAAKSISTVMSSKSGTPSEARTSALVVVHGSMTNAAVGLITGTATSDTAIWLDDFALE